MVQAQDADQALAGWQRTAPVQRQAPVEALEWERRLRPADRFGPPPVAERSSALLAAAREGQWARVARLAADAEVNVNVRDERSGQVLVLAARAGQDVLVRQLLARGAAIDALGEDGFTALGAAAFAGARSTVRLLLRAGADPARWGRNGQTALHLASVCGHVPVIDEFIAQRVSLELLNAQRESALDVAAAAQQLQAMDRLLQAGADTRFAGLR